MHDLMAVIADFFTKKHIWYYIAFIILYRFAEGFVMKIVPLFLKAYPVPLMPVIEFFGVFTKPFALIVRLFANMMAGHAIILSFTCVIFLGWSMGVGYGLGLNFISVIMMLFMNCLEVLVAFIQAYVFTLLSAVFIGLAHKEEEAE